MTFDASVDGTPARHWAEDERFGHTERVNLAALQREGLRRVVVVAPHPDDETLGAGGLIAEGAALGLEVLVVVVTDGTASHPGVAGIAERRRDEVLGAVDILAPAASVTFLGATDGRVREERDAIRALLTACWEGMAAETLLVVPFSGDGHRDHRIVGALCTELAAGLSVRVVEYPIWLWHWAHASDSIVPWARFTRLVLSPEARERKFRALGQFTSQLGDVLRPSFIENFTGDTEIFVNAETPQLAGQYFDGLYERHTDPWGFESRWYEKRKRAVTLAALPAERYRSALEIGCSIGLVTELLAERCDAVLAVDISEVAVDLARIRLAGAATVELRRADVAAEFPAGEFDLIVLSEVGYYFDGQTLQRVFAAILDHLTDGGTLVACHWLHEVSDYPLSGETVHENLRALPELNEIVVHREDDFLLEVFSRDPRSVAEREGLIS